MAARLERTKDLDALIGRNLKAIRVSQGMSQETLGGKIEITFQQIQKYEKGTNRIAASTLIQLQRALRCSLGDFFRGVEADDSEEALPISTDAAKVSRKVNGMPAWKQSLMLSITRDVDQCERDDETTTH